MLNRIRITLDPSLLQAACCIVGALLLIALVRNILLVRANRRMRTECARMEKQSAQQQMEITAMLHDAQSWRSRFQRQFDAMRTDLAHRLLQSEKSNEHAQDALDQAQLTALGNALARAGEIETRLSSGPARDLSSASEARVAKTEGTALPSLPTIEGLRLRATEFELTGLRSQLDTARHEIAALRRSLMLARRREVSQHRKTPRWQPRTN